VKQLVWTGPARADVRGLSKPAAMHILSALHRFAGSGTGDVKALQGREELRLRIGDYHLFFAAPRATLSRFAASVIAVRLTDKVEWSALF
jgi:mRNA interferase RelE/StbE